MWFQNLKIFGPDFGQLSDLVEITSKRNEKLSIRKVRLKLNIPTAKNMILGSLTQKWFQISSQKEETSPTMVKFWDE